MTAATLTTACPGGWGNTRGYFAHGCRCDTCSHATQEQRRRTRENRAAGLTNLTKLHVPTQPLEQYLLRLLGPTVETGYGTGRIVTGYTTVNAARTLHCGRHTWEGQVRRGRINLDTADRYAIRLGVHPATIWGDTWWEAS